LFHNICFERYPQPQFIVFDNGRRGEIKREFKQMCETTIIALKPSQLQVTTYHPQENAIIERVHRVVNDKLKSIVLENNHENLEEDNPFDYFLQSTAWLSCYQKHLPYNTAGNTMSTCVWQRYDSQYCLQSKLESNTKKETGHHK
jgi:hypothetical protein